MYFTTTYRIYIFDANIYIQRLCLAIIIGFPVATPKNLVNSASYVFGNFTNGTHTNQLKINDSNMNLNYSIWMDQWICFHPKFP